MSEVVRRGIQCSVQTCYLGNEMFSACINNDPSKLLKTVAGALAAVERKIAIRVTLSGARTPAERKENKAIVLFETTKNRRCGKADTQHGHVQIA